MFSVGRARRLAAAVCVIAIPIGGCASSHGSVGSPSGQPSSADCAKAERTTLPGDRPLTVLVVDNTASAVVGDLPPRARQELEDAQKRGNRLALVPVEGIGKPSAVVRTIALEPYPGVDSPAAKKARPVVLACVAHWAREERMRPSAPGSGILDAVATAARQKPERVVIVSDGFNNATPLLVDQSRLDRAPAVVADELATADALAAELAGTPILWTNLGETAQPVPQSARNDLLRLWTAVLEKAGATVEFDSQTGQRRDPHAGLPNDPLFAVEITSSRVGCAVREEIPSELLFAGDRADVHPGSRQLLAPIAARLAAGSYALVEGHTAAYGPEAGRQPFSAQRATSVAEVLVELGADRSRIAVVGHGSTRPRVDEFFGGVHSESAAARNRRVEITMGAKECLR
ncbi:OmpA family protein [Nocardia sp. NBC_00508]|uniref:OmpA family protein n=1 Tax=Nocardia sp. NBC_00508 TaxID=2975992 RepID=UPI002E816B51|nr:OmpA family protein [Nocardia sp. NBC_00508]WUD67743.1 OmpA family protein [Nocardia sp. NBC_00508]